MPTGPIDNTGSVLWYSDSGPVPNSDNYTTLIIYHGSAFNSHIFDKLLPLGKAENIRVVLPNRRDYLGSTKYSDSELAELKAGSPAFLERLGREVAFFVDWFATEHKIPKITVDKQGKKQGGISLLGWSMGVGTTLALLGQPDAVGTDMYAKLTPYLRQLINHDGPFLSFGYPQPEGYNPFTDPTLESVPAIFDNFSIWVSSYYDHPDFNSLDVSKLDTAKQLDPSKYTNDMKMPPASFTKMSKAEIDLAFDTVASVRMEFPMYFEMQAAIGTQATRALFDPETTAKVLPDVDHVNIVGTRTNWYCAFGFYGTRLRYDELVKQGAKIRNQSFYTIDGANHLSQWDIPETLFAVIVKAIRNE